MSTDFPFWEFMVPEYDEMKQDLPAYGEYI